MSKKKKRLKKGQVCQEDFTFEVFNERLQKIQKKLKEGNEIVLKADELLYDVLADCYRLSAEFSGKKNDKAHKLLKNKCNHAKVGYDRKDIQRTLLRLVYGNRYEKGSLERQKENARIATYARALNKMAVKNIGLDEAKNKLKEYGIDWWANRDKEQEVSIDKEEHSSSKNQKSLSEQTLKFFDKHNIKLNSFVIFAVGNTVVCSDDDKLLRKLKTYKNEGEYQFDDINEFNKKEGQ